MKIHKAYENLDLKIPVVTMGIFDGVHRGHKILIERLISCSREVNGESVVITFHPHPRLVLSKNAKGISFLSTLEEKTALLEKTGLDHLIIIDFTPQFSRMKSIDFVEDVLVNSIRTRFLIVGHDHNFGYKGEGNYDTIKNCAMAMGFRVEQVRGLKSGRNAISSSLIRESLLKGKLDEANKWLGYNYSLKGSVIEGKKIGRKIGFPTANINPDDQFKLIPGNGVYAVETQVDNKRMPAMLSIGSNPTVNKSQGTRSIEVHIFDFDKDIYGKEIEVIFRHRLRDEIKFENTGQLVRQMELDKANSLRLLT